MFFYIIIVLIIAIVTVAAMALGYLIFHNFQPGSAKIKADLDLMKKEIEDYVDQLIPLKQEDMELLSLNQINQAYRKAITTTAKGVFISIYNEPMIAYSYKKYVATNDNAVLYARTSRHEFVYRIKANKVKFFIDDELIGTLKENELLYSVENKRLLARINRHKDELWLPILVGDKEVASVINTDKAMDSTSRALEFVSQMGDKDEAIFLSLAVLELVNNNITT